MRHDDLLVGFDTSDDAAVYRLSDEIAVVQTIDFFPPIVDDPYDFGAIAAVNALSDVYAMGGTPLLALNIVCFPDDLDKDILRRILLGGMDVAQEAGIVIAGGHTVKDREPKYGLSVTGVVHPERIVTNAAAEPGDDLVLTKPLGSGIITTAAKAGSTNAGTVAGAVAAMRELNRAGGEAMVEAGVKSATDVTGFGLAGHLLGMLRASGVSARLRMADVPLLPGTRELAERGVVPGGTRNNLDAFDGAMACDDGVSLEDKLILCDAQTSGGLLIASPPDATAGILAGLERRGASGAVIGRVVAPDDAANTIEVAS